MGLDGFSMGNLGLGAELTSAQMATQAEQIARKESETKIKDVNKATEEDEIKRKEKEAENQKEFDDGFKKESDEEGNEEESENQSSPKIIDFEKTNPKDFSVRINPKTNQAELFNNKNEKIIETISVEELMYLVSKLNNTSGVLVNRKI